MGLSEKGYRNFFRKCEGNVGEVGSRENSYLMKLK